MLTRILATPGINRNPFCIPFSLQDSGSTDERTKEKEEKARGMARKRANATLGPNAGKRAKGVDGGMGVRSNSNASLSLLASAAALKPLAGIPPPPAMGDLAGLAGFQPLLPMTSGSLPSLPGAADLGRLTSPGGGAPRGGGGAGGGSGGGSQPGTEDAGYGDAVGEDRDSKRLRRKQSNRESARRSRLRKQAECETLQNENKGLRAEVQALRDENVGLRAKIEMLNVQLALSTTYGTTNGPARGPGNIRKSTSGLDAIGAELRTQQVEVPVKANRVGSTGQA
jgi:hypothetical protein